MLRRGGTVLRYQSLQEVLFSHPLKIHRCDAVVVGSVTARSAAELMLFMPAVVLIPMTAYGTGLRGESRIRSDHRTAVPHGFIPQFLFQIVVGPAYGHISVLRPDPLRGGTDPRQVFQHEERPLRMTERECLL